MLTDIDQKVSSYPKRHLQGEHNKQRSLVCVIIFFLIKKCLKFYQTEINTCYHRLIEESKITHQLICLNTDYLGQ